MKWLMWKDYRMNWLIVILAFSVVVVPHAIAILVTWYAKIHGYSGPNVYLYNNLGAAASTSLMLSMIVYAFIGGNAIAGERADRSAEFLAYLPISRGRIITSKLLLAFFILAFIWLVNFSILGIGLLIDIHRLGAILLQMKFLGPVLKFIGGYLVVCMMFFCVAWLFSSFMSSPAIAAGIGLFLPIFAGYAIAFILYLFDLLKYCQGSAFFIGAFCLAFASALACFSAGTWYYLRRVEP